jgi:hypothetical protein
MSVVCHALPLHSAEPVYDAATYFGTGENPSAGVWSWRGKWSSNNNLARDGNYVLLPEAVEIPFPPASGNNEPGWGPPQRSADGLYLPAVWRYQGSELSAPTIIDGSSYRARPGVLLAHPGSGRLVTVTWQAPRAGTISLAAQFQDAVSGSPAVDTGVSWFVQLRGESPLANGNLGPGGTSPLVERRGLVVKQGDLVHFGVDPRGGVSADATALIARVSYGPSAAPAPGQPLDAVLQSGPGGGSAAQRLLPGGNQTLKYGGGANDFVVLQGGTDVTDYPIVAGGTTTNYVASGILAHDQALRYDLGGATVTLKGGTVVTFKYHSSTIYTVPGYVSSGILSSTAAAQVLPYGYDAGYTMAFQPGSRIEFGLYPAGIAASGYVLSGVAAPGQSVYYSYLPGGSLVVQDGSQCSFHHSPSSGSSQSGYLKVAWPAVDTYLPYSYAAGLTAKVRAGAAAKFKFFKTLGPAAAGYLESGVLAENSVLYYGTGATLTAKVDTPVTFTFSTPGGAVASYGYVSECTPALNATVPYGSQAGALVTILANKKAFFSRFSKGNHLGLLDSGVMAPPGPVSVAYTIASPIRFATLALNEPASFARASTTSSIGYLASGILGSSQTIYTSPTTTVAAAAGATLVVDTPGTSSASVAPPPIIDADGDGFSLAEETLIGTSDTVPNNPQADGSPQTLPADVQARTLIVVGNLAQNVVKSDSKTVTIPAGSGTWLLVRAIKSEEFPKYTRDQSQYNDEVTSSASGDLTVASSAVSVNSLHASWITASNPVKSYLGYSPVDLKVLGTVTAAAAADKKVTLNLSVKNISDGILPTTGILSLIPVEVDVAKIAHNAASGELDDSKKESTGAFVPLNSDDDDYSAATTSLGSDKDQSGAITGENDLLPIYLRKIPQLTGAKFLLDIPSKIKVWKNSNRQDKVTAATEFDASVDTTVYAEGVSKGSDLLKLTLRHGGQDKADLVRLKLTVFELKGVLNVPGYATYSYTADGALPAGSKWGTPGSGTLKAGSTATQATILWGQGPVVGKAVYEVNSDYIWDLEVNVVEVALGSTNTVVYRGPPWQHAVGSVYINSGDNPAVMGRREISGVTGPTVGSTRRGEQFIEVGWVQNGTFTASHAVYNGFTPPARRVSSVEGQGPLLDSVAAAPPAWYSVSPGFHHIGGATSPFTLEFEDTPSQRGSDNMNLTIGTTTDAADQFHIRFDFTCYLAVRTTQSINASNQIYTQRSKMSWHFDGGGNIAAGVWTGTTADTGGGATYSEVKTGDQVPVTTGDTMNSVILAPTWTTQQP